MIMNKHKAKEELNKMETELIKSKMEEVNNKYDIREVFYIDLKKYSSFRFLNKLMAEKFIKNSTL